MAGLSRRKGGMNLGGGLVIAGIVVALFWSLILGIIIAVVGLVAFGGFVKGKWYLRGISFEYRSLKVTVKMPDTGSSR